MNKIKRIMRSAMTRRVAVGGVATAMLTSGLMVATTAASEAHTDDVNVTYVCNTQTGNYDGTLTLTTSNVPDNRTGVTKWRIGTGTFDGTPTSDAGMDRGPVNTTGNMTVTLGTWSLPGTTTGHGPWVYAFTKWPKPGGGNYATKGSDGQFKDNLKGDCSKPAVKDAAASVTVSQPTCEAAGTASVTGLQNATLVGTLDQSVGTHTATFQANTGHLFPNGSDTLQVSYTIPDKDTSRNCWAKDAAASVTVTPGTCNHPGTASVTGLQNATLVGTLDQSVGDHVATFKSNDGHLFPNGSDTLQVSYTVPGKDTSKSCNPPKKVHGGYKKLDKCGHNNFIKVKTVKGLHYVVRGKVVREGVWLKFKAKTVKVKVVADSSHYKVAGKKLFVVRFPNQHGCYTPPSDTPHTGLPRLMA